MTSASDPGSSPSETVRFAHNTEHQFARLLDFYRIEWVYEPREFVLGWDRHGNPTSAFAPDFYLPEFDLFIEITTMSQRLVTKKNRKVRLLRRLYPEVNCKIFYQRDYLNLLVKYGLEAPEHLSAADAEAAAERVTIDEDLRASLPLKRP